MKNLFQKTMGAAAFAVLLASCKKEDKKNETPAPINPTISIANLENSYARLLFTKHGEDSVKLLNFKSEKLYGFKTQSAAMSLNSFHEDRYAGIIHRTATGTTEFFDTGIEAHGDHAHDDEPAQMLSLKVSGNLPTHFKYKVEKVCIFNDGDGSVSVVDVKSMKNVGYTPMTIQTGAAHHGAAIAFSNNHFAATAVQGGRTSRVRVYDNTGKIEHTSDSVGSIHGQAGNGTDALFGTTDGILWVRSNKTSELLPNPTGLTNTSGNWIGTLWEDPTNDKVFYGRASQVGIFKINLNDKSITKIIDLVQNTTPVTKIVMDNAGKYIFVLLNSGEVVKYSASGSKIATYQATSPRSNVTGDAVNDIAVGKKTVFVTKPYEQKVYAYDVESNQLKRTIELGFKPGALIALGFMD